MTTCFVVDAGCLDYTDALELQRDLHAQVADGDLPGVLLLVEHEDVYTLGRRGVESDILATPERLRELGVGVHHIDRGGEVTYHGPGQLVGYPIVNLRTLGIGPLQYIRCLERAIVATLSKFSIGATSGERPTGVWVGDAKIAAMGIKISLGVTTHGFALNVDPDLSYFDLIVPCGMPHMAVTSMSACIGNGISVDSVVLVMACKFGNVFGLDIQWTNLRDLGQLKQTAAIPVFSG